MCYLLYLLTTHGAQRRFSLAAIYLLKLYIELLVRNDVKDVLEVRDIALFVFGG